MRHHTQTSAKTASDSNAPPPQVWALCDDRAGNVSQVMGVAEALGLPFVVKNLSYGKLGRLPNPLLGASFKGLDANARAALTPPWPKLVIAAGRRTAPVARRIKALSNGATALVQIMYPGPGGLDAFDLICAPRHDRIGAAANLMRIIGAPHRVTPARLAQARDQWAPQFSNLPTPRIALIVGGGTKKRAFGPELAAKLGELVNEMAAKMGGAVLATTSRRTDPQSAEALAAKLTVPQHLYRWGDERENPYFGYLALADRIVVTGDSVSMVCEACATGKPVYIFAPPGFAARKHQDFLRSIIDGGHARLLHDAGRDDWSPIPLNAAQDVVSEIKRRGLDA